MQLTLSQSHIRRLSRGLAKVIPGRGAVMPVLDQVRFSRTGEHDAEATATNLDETLTLTLPGTVTPDSGPDVFLCPFAELRNLVRDLGAGDAVLFQALPGEPPRLEVIAQIEGRDLRSRIETIHPNEFPAQGPAATMVRGEVGSLLQGYRIALPFASEDPTRPAQAGVFWHEERHSLVATDGRRLTVLELPHLTLGCDFIIPPSKVLANSILDGGEGSVGVAIEGDRHCLEITCGPWRYRVRGIETPYPNYRVVIPSDVGQFVAGVDIAAQDLPLVRSAVSRLTQDRNPAVCLCAVPDSTPLLASAVPDADGTYAHVPLANSRCTGERPHGQAVNGQYLIQCLDAGFLHLRLPSDCSPWLCAGEHAGVHCLMPFNSDATDVVASIVTPPTQEGTPPMAPEAQTTPAPATDATVAPSDSAPPAPPADGGTPTQGLSLVSPDPLQDLRSAIGEADEALRQASTVVRSLREKVRAVERAVRDREKQYARSEKVLVLLKEAASF